MKPHNFNWVNPHPGEADLNRGVDSPAAMACLAERVTYWTTERLKRASDGAPAGWVVRAYAAEVVRRENAAAGKVGA